MKNRLAAAAALVASVALIGLSGCGSGSSSDQAGDDLGLIEPGTLTCAMSGEYRPFNYFESNQELVGFDVDICKAVAAELGVTAKPVSGSFDSLIAGVQAGRFDSVIGSLTPTDERKKAVDFTQVYYTSGAQLFVQPDSTVKSVSDLKDATVGVTLGTTFEDFAKEQPGVKTVKTYGSDIEALKDLESGRLDGVITQDLIGAYQIKNADLKVSAVGDRLFEDTAAIAVKKGNTALVDALDKALTTVKDDGMYEKLSDTWFDGKLEA